MTDTPVGVEEALRELREMFPDAKFITISGDYVNHWDGENVFSTRVQIANSWRTNKGGCHFNLPSLDSCMAEIRTWKVDHQ